MRGEIKQLYSRGDIRKLIAINFMQRAIKIIIQLTDALFVQKANSNFLGLISVFNKFTTVMLLGLNSTCSTVTATLGRCFGAKDKIEFKDKFRYLQRLVILFGCGWALISTVALGFLTMAYVFTGLQLNIMRGLLVLHLVTIYIPVVILDIS